MIQSILLALTAIIVMIDVLVGLHRGLRFGVIRLLIWIAGTFVAFLIARRVTVWLLLKMAKVPDMKFLTHDTFGDWLGSYTDSIGTHLTGLEISLVVPVVFVALFIIAKIVTWIIYLIVKALIKKAARYANAHNAAVEAVTAVKRASVQPVVTEELEQPFDTDTARAAYSQENGEDFGTFGIFPKEEPKETVVQESGQLLAEPQEVITQSVEEPAEEIAVQTSAETQEEQSLEQPQESETVSEAAVSFEDGFESLARASLAEEKEETQKKQTQKKVKAPKPAKEKRPKKEKELKKRHSLAVLLVQNPKGISVAGGILGLFTGLYACAILASPVTGIARAIADSGKAEDMVSLAMTTVSVMDKDVFSNEMFEKKDRPAAEIQRDFKVVGDLSFRTDDFVDIFENMDSSPIHYIYKYSGAGFVASAIYNSLSEVIPGDVELEKKGIDRYSLADSIRCYSELVSDLNNLLNAVNSGNGLSIELIDALESTTDHIFNSDREGAVLTDSDKTDIANTIIDGLNGKLSEYEDVIPNIPYLEYFTDLSEAKDGMKNVYDTIRELIDLGVFE